MKEISEVLKHIGLTQGEIDVYLALVKYGLSTTGRITKEANIGSSKVYEVLQRLIAKGLVSYVMENNIKHFSPTPAKNLIHFIENKKKTLEKNQEALESILPELENIKPTTNNAESLIYRGKQGPLILLRELIELGKKGHELLGFGTDSDDWNRFFPAQLKEFIKESAKFKIKSRLIFQKGFKSPNKTANIKYLPDSLSSPVRTIITANKVYIVDFTEPITTIVIEKQEIATAYKHYFEALWKQAQYNKKTITKRRD